MAELAFLGWAAAVACLVIAVSCGHAVGTVLRREAELLLKVRQLEDENAGYAADNNVLRSRLTRRKNPIVPPQRKEAS